MTVLFEIEIPIWPRSRLVLKVQDSEEERYVLEHWVKTEEGEGLASRETFRSARGLLLYLYYATGWMRMVRREYLEHALELLAEVVERWVSWRGATSTRT